MREWRPIPGFEGHYEVSTDGQVVTLWHGKRRELRQATNRDGYKRVTLCSPTAGRALREVHALVLLAFCGERPHGMVTRHLDGNPANNALANLAYGTESENMRDTLRHGRHPKQAKTHCPAGHPYDEGNTYVHNGHRWCRACTREAGRRYRARKKAL